MDEYNAKKLVEKTFGEKFNELNLSKRYFPRLKYKINNKIFSIKMFIL